MSLLLRQKLPDFPWDALAPYGAIAKRHPQGAIDLSVGTPVDATPEFIQKAFREASNSPSYPVTVGTPELREAITTWAKKYLGATGEFGLAPKSLLHGFRHLSKRRAFSILMLHIQRI
jgi:aspartate/methionine/tyrosine aminotransferase